MPNSHMNDGLLKEFNLEPTCETMPEGDLNGCWNTLRFTDLMNSTKLNNGMGIDNQVTCKLLNIAAILLKIHV